VLHPKAETQRRPGLLQLLQAFAETREQIILTSLPSLASFFSMAASAASCAGPT